VSREDQLWFCGQCGAEGTVVRGETWIDFGVRGSDQEGYWTVQLSDRILSVLREKGHFDGYARIAEDFDSAAQRWYLALTTTTFDIPDADVAAASAQDARNRLGAEIRSDDRRFHLLTGLAAAGWHWRIAERSVTELAAINERARFRVEQYRESAGFSGGRSEIFGLGAGALAGEQSVFRNGLGGDADFGDRCMDAAFYLCASTFIKGQDWLASEASHYPGSFAFGVALREVDLAWDVVSAAQT
jgi:hypothetical protein